MLVRGTFGVTTVGVGARRGTFKDVPAVVLYTEGDIDAVLLSEEGPAETVRFGPEEDPAFVLRPNSRLQLESCPEASPSATLLLLSFRPRRTIANGFDRKSAKSSIVMSVKSAH